jgi:hypothetical protein
MAKHKDTIFNEKKKIFPDLLVTYFEKKLLFLNLLRNNHRSVSFKLKQVELRIFATEPNRDLYF